MNHQVTPEAIHLCDDSVKLSDRITRLIEQYHSIVPPLCVERARLLTETYRQTESKPHALRRALSLENILNHIGIFMCDDDMLLGAIAEKRRGSSVFPEFGVQFIENELTGNPVDFSTISWSRRCAASCWRTSCPTGRIAARRRWCTASSPPRP